MTAIALAFLQILKLATFGVFILGVIWINRRHGTRKKEAAVLTQEEQGTLDQLIRIADKMEQRLGTLEKILDAEHPTWKERT